MWWFPNPLTRRRTPAGKRSGRGRRPAVEALETRAVPALFPGPYPPTHLTDVNGTLFFSVLDPSEGGELWKSDGTEAGTVQIATFPHPAPFIDLYAVPTNLTNVGGTLFFTAYDEEAGFELWKSDGTPEGTVLVKDIFPGPTRPPGLVFPLFRNSSSPDNLTDFNGTLYFTAEAAGTGRELWKSDGTAAGTVLVKDLNPGSGGSFAWNLTPVGETLYFAAHTPATGYELWKSDGTAAGTALVLDINPGAAGSLAPSDHNFFAGVGGTLLFAANDGTSGRELWRSDGTAAGTALVADINPGGASAITTSFFTSTFRHHAVVGDTLFFAADDGANGRELWKSDATAAGTALVQDLRPGSAGSAPLHLTAVGATLFFVADDGASGAELWKSDGTAEGTVRLSDINPGGGSGVAAVPSLTAVGGTLFFVADDGASGQQLWKSDGTAEGTVLVADVLPLRTDDYLESLTAVGGTLFFTVTTTDSAGLWKSDGTAAGTELVKDFGSGFGLFL